jgi:aminoglycoside 6-adenylyltransferase
MRSEKEMLDLILNTAKNDERIRAVIMNGSRANPNAPQDFFQDFDIVFVVTDVGSFTRNHGWVSIFGELMIMQMPKTMVLSPEVEDGSFAYLMQFADGNRIDLTLIPQGKVDEILAPDSESILLLDKDHCIKPFAPASDRDYLIQPPTAKMFADCCNEFWWVSPYAAKGIWRDELPYAMSLFNEAVRDMLNTMLKWHIGIRTDFSVSAGKQCKYFKKYLDPELWNLYCETYASGDYASLWKAFFTACDLFRKTAQGVAQHFGYDYPQADDDRVTAHLRHVMNLPRDANEMY